MRKKYFKYYKLSYGTAQKDRETVSFIEATDYLRNEKQLTYKLIAEKIGLSRSQMDMVRIKRRYLTKSELDRFLQVFPETKHFFSKPPPDKAKEPMLLYNDGNTLKSLVETQRKLIEKLEGEVKELRHKVVTLEVENKTLKSILQKYEK